MTKKLLSSVSLFLSLAAFSQANYWTKTNNVMTKQLKERKTQASKQQLFSLNLEGLKNKLATAPERFSKNESLILKFPDATGKLRDYVVQEASVMAPELQAKFSDIRSYIGWEKGNSQNSIRFSVTPTEGVSIMYFDGWETSYLDAYTNDLSVYTVYKRDDLARNPETFNCDFDKVNDFNSGLDVTSSLKAPVVRDGNFRTYRLALACTIEYAKFHITRAGLTNGTLEQKKAAVMSSFAVAMTRVDGVYEKTVSLTMVMVPNNDQLIFIDSDEYSNNSGGAMLGENQTVVDRVIGTANYDIGHVFSTGGGGVAYLQSPCGIRKAGGVTGLPTPINDGFYIDYVAHEMGHQFGGNHTFNNNTQGSCSGNSNPGTAVEPGGGSTIMAYAGICGAANNIQSHSDPYFHTVTVGEMYSFISRTSDCSVKTPNNNLVPLANAATNFFIPKSTAFVMTGEGSDPDGDPITFLWEQIDNQESAQPPVETSTGGPLFRSYLPTVSNQRYFPAMASIMANNLTPIWEKVPSVARTLNFALLVNDNKATGNQAARANSRVFVVNAGPFKVTSHTTSGEYDAGVPTSVTWDVAGTNAGDINTQNVQILFTKDNGLTFTELAASVPNNGSASVMLPNEDVPSARIMVKAIGNVFLAVNTTAFSVKKNLAVADIAKKGFLVYPNPAKSEINITVNNKAVATDYSIFDQSGRLLKSGRLSSDNKVNVADLATGAYRLVVVNNGATYSQSLIIKK